MNWRVERIFDSWWLANFEGLSASYPWVTRYVWFFYLKWDQVVDLTGRLVVVFDSHSNWQSQLIVKRAVEVLLVQFHRIKWPSFHLCVCKSLCYTCNIDVFSAAGELCCEDSGVVLDIVFAIRLCTSQEGKCIYESVSSTVWWKMSRMHPSTDQDNLIKNFPQEVDIGVLTLGFGV
jgi:hypothetical protein